MANPNYDVKTSEDIFDGEPPEVRHDLETAKAELLHANTAHVIIALIMGSPRQQGGVYRELDVISAHRELREKTWIFYPAERRFERQFAAGALRNFRDDHRIPCTKKMIRECESIRKMCIDKADMEYYQLRLDHMHASMGS